MPNTIFFWKREGKVWNINSKSYFLFSRENRLKLYIYIYINFLATFSTEIEGVRWIFFFIISIFMERVNIFQFDSQKNPQIVWLITYIFFDENLRPKVTSLNWQPNRREHHRPVSLVCTSRLLIVYPSLPVSLWRDLARTVTKWATTLAARDTASGGAGDKHWAPETNGCGLHKAVLPVTCDFGDSVTFIHIPRCCRRRSLKPSVVAETSMDIKQTELYVRQWK